MMTEKQLNEAIAIIQADCELQYRYCDEDGKTCVLGALGLAAGIAKADLIEMGAQCIICFWSHCNQLANAIETKFGIERQVQGMLQNINDDNEGILYLAAPSVEERRQKIVDALKGEYEKQQRNHPR